MNKALSAWVRSATRTDRPLLVVLAGSNGAGKSTFYRRYLRATKLPFVNADDIARALYPGAPDSMAYQAMRVAERIRENLLRLGVSFCMETVLSDTKSAKLDFFRLAQSLGFRVVLIHIRLASPQLSQARVHQRVNSGGHDVPASKLVARFPRTAENAARALSFVDYGLVLDNSSALQPFQVVATWVRGACMPARQKNHRAPIQPG